MSQEFGDWVESDAPSNVDASFRWSIRRTSHLKPLKFAVVSNRHFGMYTHFHHGRTMPHFKNFCQGCNDGKRLAWYGYVLAKIIPTGEQIVFEYPPKAAQFIEEAEKDHQTLRGLVFTATRPGGKENSKVLLVKADKLARLSDLPADEPIRPVLAHIFGYKTSAADEMQKQVLSDASEAERVAAGFKYEKVSAADFAAATENDIVLLPGQDRLFQRSFTEPNGHALPIVQ